MNRFIYESICWALRDLQEEGMDIQGMAKYQAMLGKNQFAQVKFVRISEEELSKFVILGTHIKDVKTKLKELLMAKGIDIQKTFYSCGAVGFDNPIYPFYQFPSFFVNTTWYPERNKKIMDEVTA